MNQSLNSFHIDAELRQDLGTVVIVSAWVDALIAELLSYVLSADKGSMYAVTQETRSGTQTKWIRTLLPLKFNAESVVGLNKLLDRADNARGDRNIYVHGMWSRGSEAGTATVQTIKLGRSNPIKNNVVTRTHLTDLAARLQEIGTELQAIGNTLGFFD